MDDRPLSEDYSWPLDAPCDHDWLEYGTLSGETAGRLCKKCNTLEERKTKPAHDPMHGFKDGQVGIPEEPGRPLVLDPVEGIRVRWRQERAMRVTKYRVWRIRDPNGRPMWAAAHDVSGGRKGRPVIYASNLSKALELVHGRIRREAENRDRRFKTYRQAFG